MSEGEKRKEPNMCTYNPVKAQRLRNFAKVLSSKCELTNDVEFLATQTPGFKYDMSKGQNLVRPRILFGSVLPENKKQSISSKIPKSKDPDVGTYNMGEAYKRTQVHGVEKNSFKINTGKGKTMIDVITAKTKFVPGPGTYKDFEKGFTRLSVSPPSIRVRRH
jgi:hypothetical protein